MRKFRPISRKITFAILIPLSILLSITLLFSRWSVSDQVRTRIDQDITRRMNELELLATTGINPSTGDPFQNSDSLLETFLSRRIARENETMFGTIDSIVTFRSLGNQTLRPDKDKAFLEIVNSEIIPKLDTYYSNDGELRYGVVPIIGLDQRVGRLVIVTNVDADLAATNELFRNLAIGLVAFFGLTGIVLSYIVKRNLSPISELTTAAQNVSKDNFIRQLDFETTSVDDEITQLGLEFNNMLSRLEISFADQQRFIDDAGHELRTPLTILKGHLELLQQEIPNLPSMLIIEDEINRMARLVQDLQSLTKATQPNFIRIDEFASDVFIKEVQEKAQSIHTNSIELESFESKQVFGDKQRLTQAMLQLIENAVKYSPANSVITIGLSFRGRDLMIYVKDEGVGISSEAKEQVFSRFYQVDNTHSTRDVGGVGLGLAIVKAIVDGHKGSVSIVDNYPRGSVFEITIPQEARLA